MHSVYMYIFVVYEILKKNVYLNIEIRILSETKKKHILWIYRSSQKNETKTKKTHTLIHVLKTIKMYSICM